MAKEFGKTSLCGVRHVGDVRATEDEGGREERTEGGRVFKTNWNKIRAEITFGDEC